MGGTSRRDFLAGGLFGAGAISLGLYAYGKHGGFRSRAEIPETMGPLGVVRDEATGLPLLRLPEGFRYRSLSWAGSELHDGHPVPGAADGMGVVRQEGSRVTLVRNHELQGSSGAMGDPARAYDNTPGGTTTLEFDTLRGELVDSRVSLGGTLYNCAGGVTPWGTWLSCEEGPHSPDLVHLPKPKKQQWWDVDRARKEHGWVFEVPPDGVAEPRPIKALGQFYHEAVAFDAATGIAYLTEDNGPRAGFYRFLPNAPGDLHAGGRLQMMKVERRPDMRQFLTAGVAMDVDWVDIPEPERGFTPGNRNGDGVVSQGVAAGGSAFVALEGCACSDGRVYFTSKVGGRAMAGCVFEYHPQMEKLWVVYESPAYDFFSGPDNLVVSPRGSLLICEDRLDLDKAAQNLAGLNREGELFRFCQVNPDLSGEYGGHDLAETALKSEWAGATFSKDGEWLFVNLYSPGVTLAITGPWQAGYI
ncbi:MAG: PhoX family protein [Gammaproteobacteria bacterium]|jgi:secreted PhoX family phosphatase|nr:PhoX family protein [Gammaproteobacteria bacterium]